MFHLHGVHHGQHLAALHLVTRLDGKGHHLAGHGRGQAAALHLRITRVGQRINCYYLRSTMGSKDVGYNPICINVDDLAVITELDVDALVGALESKRRPLAGHLQLQRAIVQRGEKHHLNFALELKVKPARTRAVRAPAVLAGPGVQPHGLGGHLRLLGFFLQQGVGHSSGHRQVQSDFLLLEQHSFFARNQGGVQISLGERAALHHVAQKLHIGVEAHDVGCGQCGIQTGQCLLAGVAMHDQLGDHGVVKRRNHVALAHAGVHPHPATVALKSHAIRQAIHMQRAGGGQKVVVRALGTNAGLDGVAGDLELVLAQGQRLATGHAQLPLHQVLPGDGFGHRMLHLQAGVHLHEEKGHRAIGLLLHDEFHRARAHVVHSAGGGHSGLTHLPAKLRRHAGRGRFFQHLLVAPLHRAVALEQVHVVALGVAKDLNLDVARALHVLFDQHGVIAKAVDRFALATGQGRCKVF